MKRAVFIMILLLLLATAFAKTIPLGKRTLTKNGDGNLVTLFQYFTDIATQVGGKAAFSFTKKSFLNLKVPRFYTKGMTLDEAARRFCTFYKGFNYKIQGMILTVFPSTKSKEWYEKTKTPLSKNQPPLFKAGHFYMSLDLAFAPSSDSYYEDPAVTNNYYQAATGMGVYAVAEYALSDYVGIGTVFRYIEIHGPGHSPLDPYDPRTKVFFFGLELNYHTAFAGGDVFVGFQAGMRQIKNNNLLLQEKQQQSDPELYDENKFIFIVHFGFRLP